MKKGENMDKSWINEYHSTDQEIYREIIYTAIIDTTKVVDDKVIVDEHLKKLYQEINIASTPAEIMKIKKEYWINHYHDTDKEVYREIIFSEMIDSKKKGDDELFTELAKLHQQLYEATKEEEIIKIKQEFHSL